MPSYTMQVWRSEIWMRIFIESRFGATPNHVYTINRTFYNFLLWFSIRWRPIPILYNLEWYAVEWNRGWKILRGQRLCDIWYNVCMILRIMMVFGAFLTGSTIPLYVWKHYTFVLKNFFPPRRCNTDFEDRTLSLLNNNDQTACLWIFNVASVACLQAVLPLYR